MFCVVGLVCIAFEIVAVIKLKLVIKLTNFKPFHIQDETFASCKVL